MDLDRQTLRTQSQRLWQFLWRVITAFRANQGLLLSGAIAYYTLLSIIPLLALLLVGLSHVFDDQQVLAVIVENVEMVIPGQAQPIVDQIEWFMDNRDVMGWVGIGVMLFFSSLAFTVLENAMSVIFFHRVAIRRRHFLVSAILPYLFIVALGLGLMVVSMVSGALQTLEAYDYSLLGRTWSPVGLSGIGLYLLGVVGVILMMTAIYLVMPVGHIEIRHALIGGITAGLLWEVMRHILVWYFSTLSLVNVIYGSLGATIVVLVALEVGAMILLLGAQVIAEYERIGEEETSMEVFPEPPETVGLEA